MDLDVTEEGGGGGGGRLYRKWWTINNLMETVLPFNPRDSTCIVH